MERKPRLPQVPDTVVELELFIKEMVNATAGPLKSSLNWHMFLLRKLKEAEQKLNNLKYDKTRH